MLYIFLPVRVQVAAAAEYDGARQIGRQPQRAHFAQFVEQLIPVAEPIPAAGSGRCTYSRCSDWALPYSSQHTSNARHSPRCEASPKRQCGSSKCVRSLLIFKIQCILKYLLTVITSR